MNWLRDNGAAIQAFASIGGLLITLVLAGLTAWYVRVTKTIATSALDQVKHLKETTRVAQQQAARSLEALSKRIRLPLVGLDPTAPKHRPLAEYGLLSQEDVTYLETLARDVNADAIRYAGKAAVSLRKILALMEQARQVNFGTGWIPSSDQIRDWREAMDAAPKMLTSLEATCQAAAA